MQVEINLKNKEQAAQEIKKVQTAIDELLDVCNQQKTQLQENIKTISEAEAHSKTLENSAVDMSDAMKAIHRILQSKKELFEGDQEMKAVLDSLATFVVSSGAIKLGVISNARNNDEKES